MIRINAPEPSRYTSNSDIDEIALVCNKLYREKCGNAVGFPVDVEHFADSVLEVSIEQSYFKAPKGVIAYARCKPDERDPSRFLIQFNEAHQNIFNGKPEIYRSVGSHEVGHIVLKHHAKLACNLTKSLFDDFITEPKCLHKTEWRQCAFSDEELKILCEAAVAGNDQVRSVLLNLDNHLEEEWMFWQAEHFVKCFLIPKDRLMEVLESNFDITDWRVIYKLGIDFGVSGSMLASRLKKIGAIDINGKQITLGKMFKHSVLI